MSADYKVQEFIVLQSSIYSDLADSYLKFGQLYDGRLWHQLTNALIEFVYDANSFRGTNLIELHSHFIKYFEDQINQLQYARLVVKIAEQYCPSVPFDNNQLENAVEFLQQISGAGVEVPEVKVEEKMEVEEKEKDKKTEKKTSESSESKSNKEDTNSISHIIKQKKSKLTDSGYLIILGSVIKLETKLGRVEKVKFLVDEALDILETISSAEPIVYASVYSAKAEYHKQVGPASDYYNTALQFLAYTPIEELKGKKMVELAIDLSLASLVGEDIYNFGEVLASPIMNSLVKTEFEWLFNLVSACNHGDINTFNTICAEHANEFKSQPALASSFDVIKQKVALLAFVELVFHRSSTQRVVSFVDIAKATSLPLDQVEWLLMKSMSIGLIRGTIDELDKLFNVTWVQPRVLDASQMESIQGKLTEWSKTCQSTLLYVEDNMRGLLD